MTAKCEYEGSADNDIAWCYLNEIWVKSKFYRNVLSKEDCGDTYSDHLEAKTSIEVAKAFEKHAANMD